MGNNLGQSVNFGLHTSSDSIGSHFHQGISGHRASVSSYWEQPLLDNHSHSHSHNQNQGHSHGHNQSSTMTQSISHNANSSDIVAQNSSSSSNNTIIMDTSMHAKSSGYNTTLDSENDMSADAFRLELQLKETQIESLELEIKKLKGIFNQGLTFKQQEEQKLKKSKALTYDSEVQIPASLEIIFCKLSDSLKRKDQELQETKRRLEGIITAVALNPSNSVTKFGRYDEEALAHKMVTRLETLMKENEEMAKMLSYGRSKETTIELELLRKENQELKDRLRWMEHRKTAGPAVVSTANTITTDST